MTILCMNTGKPFWQGTCYVYNVDGLPIFQPSQNSQNFIALEVCTLQLMKRKLTLKILKSNPGYNELLSRNAAREHVKKHASRCDSPADMSGATACVAIVPIFNCVSS